MIQVHDVVFAYPSSNGGGKRFSLRCHKFAAPAGQVTCLIGRNGSGKSTFLRVLGGKIPYESGSVLFQGHSIRAYSKAQLLNHIGWIDATTTQALVDELMVVDHLALALSLAGRSLPFFHRSVPPATILSASYLPAPFKEEINLLLEKKIGSLSEGQKQKVSIALAALDARGVILADESTSHLDLFSAREFFSTMGDMAKRNSLGVVIVTHDIALAAEFGDQVYFVDQGEITPFVLESCVSTAERLDLLIGALSDAS